MFTTCITKYLLTTMISWFCLLFCEGNLSEVCLNVFLKMDIDTFEDYDFVGSCENFHSVNEDRPLCRPIS